MGATLPVQSPWASVVFTLALLGEVLVDSRPCLDSDWQFGFSECLEDSSGSRSRGLFAYAPGGSTCDTSHPNSRPLPDPLLRLPCQELCEAGTRLAVELAHPDSGPAAMRVGCRPCGRGSFSLGGGLLTDGAGADWARPWPSGLSTFCFYRGSDYKWHAGSSPPLLCVLHLRADGRTEGDLPAETRPGLWNAALPDRELNLPLVVAPGDAKACQAPSSEEAARLRGAAVLVLRGTCSFQNKTEKLAAAGALAVVLYNSVLNAGYFYPAAVNRSRTLTIPIFMVTRETGLRWRSTIEQAQAGVPRIHIPSTRCSEAAKEALPVGRAEANNSAEALQKESWEKIGSRKFCAHWASDPSGRFLHSGNNLHYHWIYSILTLGLRFVRDGYLRFRYSVDAEDGFDGLSFRMDLAEEMKLESRRSPYRDFEIKVPRGAHTFTWVYSKDYRRSFGEDRARLQLLEAAGTAYSDMQCYECRGGGRPGTGCDTCKRNSYLGVGANDSRVCLPCPAGKWSVPGSVGAESCYAHRPCGPQDLERTYAAFETVDNVRQPIPGEHCRRNQSLVRYRWRQPALCDPNGTGATRLPGDEVDWCPPCQPYQARSRGAACEPVARACSTGSQAVRELRIAHWHTWPSNFSKELWGVPGDDVSGSGGWRLAADNSAVVVGTAFSSSTGMWEALSPHDHSEVALLHLDVVLDNPGNLTFTVEPLPSNAWGRMARLSVNGTSATGEVSSVQADSALQVVSLPLPVGPHRITWAWHYHADMEAVDAGVEAESSGLRLVDVAVTHALGAGTARCEPCPSGAEVAASGSSCTVCPAGRSTTAYASGGASRPSARCSPCPPGRASQAGAAACHSCGPGLYSNASASHCRPQALVELPARGLQKAQQWDINALAEAWHQSSWSKTAVGWLANSSLRAIRVEGRHYYLGLFLPGPKPQLRRSGQHAEAGLSPSTSSSAYWWEHLPPLSSLEEGDAAVEAGVCPPDDGFDVRSVAETFEAIRPTARDEVPGLWATFTGACGPGGERLRRSGIFFRCDTTAFYDEQGSAFDVVANAIADRAWETPDLSFVEGQRPTSPRSCEDIALQWRTIAACPLCRREDFEAVATTRCEAGRGQKLVYMKVRPCHGGVEAPQAYWERCHRKAAVSPAIAVPLAAVLCCLGSYVMILRRRYAKYMKLEDPGNAVPPAQIGAPNVA